MRIYPKRGKIYAEIDRGLLRGKRVRFIRSSFEAAVAAAEKTEREILTHGELAVALTSEQRWMAAQAFSICSRLGVVLIDVVREFERTHPHGENARTLDQVREELIEAKRRQQRSERHLLSLDYRLRALVAALGDKPITAITTQELQAELARHVDWSATTIHGVVQGWKIAFNFAIRRGYLVNNPANRLELPKIIHDEPTIFSVDEVRRLMAATLFSDVDLLRPACRAYLAIGIFAGLRPDEIDRLEWQQVDLETATIRVKAANAKDRDRRIVDIQPNLAAWLRTVARSRGRVLTRPIGDLRVVARRILGLDAWPHDIMRHTFVSYHFAEFQSEAATKKQVGHRDDGRIFYNHYMVPVSRADARRFWATVPPVALLAAA